MAKVNRGDCKRKKTSRDGKSTLLIVSQGEVTEKEYFKKLRREIRTVEITVNEKSKDPRNIIDHTLNFIKYGSKDFDTIWCVVDVDNTKKDNFSSARAVAQKNGINIIISDPCFELWALLHRQNVCDPILTIDAQARFKFYFPDYVKKLPYDHLVECRPKAISRAKALPKGKNPSTDVYRLVEKILSFQPKTSP